MRVLELVSVVLRDSDQIEDGAKKQDALENVLRHWGQLMSTLDQDPEFLSFVREVGSRVSQLQLQKKDHEDESSSNAIKTGAVDPIEEFAKLFPAAISYGGVNEYLASRRLLVPLGDVVKIAKRDSRLELTIASAFMLCAVKEPGWVGQLKDLLSARGNVWVIREFLLTLMIADYVRGNVTGSEGALLRELILDIVERSYRYNSINERSTHRGKLAQQLDSERNRWDRDADGDPDDIAA